MSTYIYVLDSVSFVDEGNKYVKIGSSNNPLNRREALQTAIPRKLKIIRVYEILNYTAYVIDDFLKTINTFSERLSDAISPLSDIASGGTTQRDGFKCASGALETIRQSEQAKPFRKCNIHITHYQPDDEGGTEHYIIPDLDDLEKLFDLLEIEYVSIQNMSIFDRNKKHIDHINNNAIYLNELSSKLKDKCSPKWILKPHQREAVDEFISQCLEGTIRTSIVSHPTGAGKTITAIAMIGRYWEKYNGSVLWLTERKDVLRSQFGNNDKITKCTEAGLIQPNTFYTLKILYGTTINMSKLNKSITKKPTLIVTNTDSIMGNNKYEEFDKSRIGLVIFDECHSAGAIETYNMLKYMSRGTIVPPESSSSLELSQNLSTIIIGFSATPLRQEAEKYKRIVTIFGNGEKINCLSHLSLIDAIDHNIIVPPKFIWLETNLSKNITFAQFTKNLDIGEYVKILEQLNEVLNKSTTKKAIAWTQSIKNANEWKKIILSNQTDKYPELSTYKIFITHTRLDNDELDEFIKYDEKCMIICVGRCREGFDDPRVDVCINLDTVQERGTIVFTQETGRALRIYNNKEFGIMMDTFTFSEETNKKEQICDMLIGYFVFLKQSINYEACDVHNEYETFQKSMSIDKKGNITYITPNKNVITFTIVSTTLKKTDWKDIKLMISEKFKQILYRDGISYQTAKNIISRFPKMYTKKAYLKICKRDARLPKDPVEIFGDKFISWIDYLGITKKYYDLEECRKKVKRYFEEQRIFGVITNYDEICKELRKKDKKFPPRDFWVDYYKSDGAANITNIIESQDEKISINDILSK